MANTLQRLWSATMAGYKAFNQNYFSTDQAKLDKFSDVDARRLRYSVNWAMYENNAFDNIVHTWSQKMKTDKGLYKHIRNIYNPSYRLGEFWKAKLLGGKLDPLAGDGVAVPSALPIITENEELRPAIAQIWEWSNWQIKKDVFGLRTPILGDGVLKIVDNPDTEKVYIKSIHPGRLKDVTLDDFGNVKGYILEYQREDPRENRTGLVTYKEVCTKDGDDIYYQTFLDGGEYAWDTNPKEGDKHLAEWSEEYGFVPMVVLQHNDVGLDFGWSELHPGMSKFFEVDDQASKLDDQIRKLVEGAWLLAGVADPSTKKNAAGLTVTPRATGQTATDEKPQPARTEQKYLYSTDANAKAHSLVADIKIAEVVENINGIIKEIERDYPELRLDLANATGDISGRALRINRSPAVAKVLQRRPNYDNAMVRAQQMAVAIAGYAKYEGFEKFNLDSYSAGKLDHSIGDRPVFENDPVDDLEENKLFWENAKLAKESGVPLAVYLKFEGWEDEAIKEITESEEYKLRLEASKNAVESARMVNPAIPSKSKAEPKPKK